MYQLSQDHNPITVDRCVHVKAFQFDAGGRINGGLAIYRDNVILDTLQGDVIAVDLQHGTPSWTTHLDNVTMSTPIVANGLVIIGTGKNVGGSTDHRYTYASGNGALPVWGRVEGDHIVALRLSDGKKEWSYRTPGEDMPSPGLSGTRLFFSNGDFHAYALNLINGSSLWRSSLDGISTMASATPLAGGVLLSVCADFNHRSWTYYIRQDDGRIIWRSPYGSCDSSPTSSHSLVFVSGVVGSHTRFGYGGRSYVAALKASTGEPVWRVEDAKLGPYTSVGSSERAIAGAYSRGSYFQSFPTSNIVMSIDVSGRPAWRFTTMSPVKMSPLVYRNRVIFGDTAGLLYSLDVRSGVLARVTPFEQPFATSPPVILNERLLIANGSTLYVLPIARVI